MKPLILIQALTAIITIQLSYGNNNDPISLAPESYLVEEQELNPFQVEDSLHTLSKTDIIQINQDSDARLDSVIIELRDGVTKILKKWNKKDYVYNAKGQIIRELRYYRWHDTKLTWIIGDADDYEYDSNGNESSRTKTNWNKFTEEWEIVDRYETSYDEFGNDTLQIYYYYDLGVKTPVSKRVRNYDAQGNILIDSKYKWNIEENIWEGKSLSNYEYNDENRQTVIISSDWENNNWRFSDMSVSVYDSLENTYFVFYYKWDTSLSDWRNNSFWETIIDENGNLVAKTYSIWNSANKKWVRESYFGNEYVYNEQNRLLLHISSRSQYADPSLNINITKDLYSYDTLGLQMIEYHCDWDTDVDDWTFPIKNEYQLLPDNINQKTTFRWSTEELMWLPTRIEKFDSVGNKVFFRGNVLTCIKDFQYVCDTNQKKMFYAYDSSGKTTQELYYIYREDENEWSLSSGFYIVKELNNNLLIKESKYVWDYELGNWSIGNRINYYYSNDTTPQNSVDFFQIDIFPNPASDYLVIRSEELAAYNTVKVEITDLFARNVLTESSYSNKQPIYFNGLNAGVYIIKISHLDRVLYVGQIVIK